MRVDLWIFRQSRPERAPRFSSFVTWFLFRRRTASPETNLIAGRKVDFTKLSSLPLVKLIGSKITWSAGLLFDSAATAGREQDYYDRSNSNFGHIVIYISALGQRECRRR